MERLNDLLSVLFAEGGNGSVRAVEVIALAAGAARGMKPAIQAMG
jgi:hypothetical protein